jgi:GrpB-like predicted nucleotidyltransferase (UPF0157 family)
MTKRSDSVLGLENNVVRLSDHSPLWADLYREEENRLRSAVGHLIIDLQHIGSTSIRGVKAKPILDMMAGVAQLDKALLCQEPLAAIGYDYIAQAGIANDYVFGKGLARTHYLHVVEYGGEIWTDHLCFRDRLRSDPQLAREYERLKEELSRRFSESRAGYHDAKSKFISAVVAASRRAITDKRV